MPKYKLPFRAIARPRCGPRSDMIGQPANEVLLQADISDASDVRKQKPPEGGSQFKFADRTSASGDLRSRFKLPAVGHETHTEKAQDHHGPGRRLRSSGGDIAKFKRIAG
jgi:hypothetical protein